MSVKGTVTSRMEATRVKSKTLTTTLSCLAVLTAAAFWFLASSAPTAKAHGTLITFSATYTAQGKFEGGEVMSNAEVSIFTPEDPETPWEQGIADEEGRYTFTPDGDLVGDWTVSYRSAGHGDIAYIPVGVSTGAGGLTGGLQRGVMAIAVIWGFIGTALYFQAKQSSSENES